MAQTLEAEGGKGGNKWDDSADNENVTKIIVRGGLEGIQYVQFDYVKNGQTKSGPIHGTMGKGFTQQPFEINQLKDEHLVSVKGWYDNVSGVIQGLQFETNHKTSDVIGYEDGNYTKFTLEVSGKKIIGFHGYAEANLNSLGAYFTTLPPIKQAYEGGSGGAYWDDGAYTGVRKVYITYTNAEIKHIKTDYDNGGILKTIAHGSQQGTTAEFVIDYPNEYITSVEGSCDQGSAPSNRARSLTFKTSKGRVSPTYGNVFSRKFVFESKGRALVGFHGRCGFAIDALGAWFGPVPIPPSEKLQAKGGNGGDLWDDGAFDGLKKIYVGQGQNGVVSVKFEYYKNNSVVAKDDHGKTTLLGYEEFEVDFPNEYITAVEGCYDKILGSENGVITMLKFKTNKRTSPQFGMDSASSFVVEKKGYKIVGFHGNASHEVHQLGVHVVPITQ
ncbi:unnamed protein product [Eruca vesicaria subsp. sativa]|uniref:Jacalin-type lectin domain-containing protein n=1 Tax=Eruca vesicaria subsp. sativa TaxID=29727 RepID=A0ABC8J1N0_ERUVS|nr:unnamed protein product [Eruca vesicaria subsp. sativa]